ncbi:MAG: hypothetical protein P1P81_04385 [Desulfobulbales bacterium]|nr:hypothetical protein [Desulfobulbales bacterium]
MGKGTIISAAGLGQYSLALNLDRGRVTAELARLARQLVALNGMEPTAAVVLRKAALQKRVDYLTANVEADPVVTAWCADLTDDLTGVVGTIEIPGERAGVPVLIRPGHNGAAAYSAARDGHLQPILASTPAAAVYNLAMMPGWQKWLPTYRLGEITAKSGDSCSIAVDPAVFSDRGSGLSANINVNQNTVGGAVTIANVPIEYMTCNGSAFKVGDRVVIEFTGQDWSAPKVIGFESEPQSCAAGVIAIRLGGAYSVTAAWNPGWYPTSQEDLVLVWNLVNNAPLQVSKRSTGGDWTYPISWSEYDYGTFWYDLRAQYGAASTGRVGFYPLFQTLDQIIVTDVEIKASAYFGSRAVDIRRQYRAFSRPEISWMFTEPWPDCQTKLDEAYNYLYESVNPGMISDDLYEFNGSTPNQAGGTDDWAESRTYHSNEQYPGGTVYWGQDGDGKNCYYDQGTMHVWGNVDDSNFFYTSSNVATVDITAPIGGITDFSALLGYPRDSTAQPTPARTRGYYLAVANSSGAAPRTLGQGLVWQGSGSSSSSFATDVSLSPYFTDISFAVSLSGVGTLTAISGAVFSITASFEESGSVKVYSGDPFTWPSNYSAGNISNFAEAVLWLASGYNTGPVAANCQAIIAIETVVTAHAENTWTLNTAATEWEPPIQHEPTVTNFSASYHVTHCLADLVPDGDTYNPWDLPENPELKSAVEAIITVFLAKYPPLTSAGRWELRPSLQLITW